MNLRCARWLAGAIGLALVAAFSTARQDEPPPRPPEDSVPQAGVEVQARGPVHEAFAEPSERGPFRRR